ncbi:MAG TPA: hypothetical protein DCY94_05085 [Firmicutes bacterium]|nr:hypothetical protein [Bacillota bacterium]
MSTKKYAVLAIPREPTSGTPFFYKSSETNENEDGHQDSFLEFLTRVGIKTTKDDVYKTMSEIGWISTVIIGDRDIMGTYIPDSEITPHQRTFLRRLKKFFAEADIIEFSSLDGEFYEMCNVSDKDEFLETLYENIDEYYKNKNYGSTIR